jgi:hypothetical protein
MYMQVYGAGQYTSKTFGRKHDFNVCSDIITVCFYEMYEIMCLKYLLNIL